METRKADGGKGGANIRGRGNINRLTARGCRGQERPVEQVKVGKTAI